MSKRTAAADAWQYLYKTAAWAKLQAEQLAREPWCLFHLRIGRMVPATVADHIKAHKGNRGLFFDKKNLQSLCAHCHSSVKQRIENRSIRPVGVDGWPLERAKQ